MQAAGMPLKPLWVVYVLSRQGSVEALRHFGGDIIKEEHNLVCLVPLPLLELLCSNCEFQSQQKVTK